MDPRLAKAATLGDLNELSKLLEEDPLTLEKVDLLSPISETPMHIATLAWKTDFLKQIIKLKPSFAWELNKDGFTPLHIASATGNLEAVTEILKLGHELCLIKDKNGRIPLHLAAIKGRVEVIRCLVDWCPDSVKEVTTWGETAIHLAVKNSQFEAVKALVEKVSEKKIDEVMNAKDKDGKSMFQIAVARKQVQIIEFLKNYQSKSDMEMEIIEVPSQDQAEDDEGGKVGTDLVTGGKEEQDLVLVVASLIATVTYQAGLSPPSTIWREGMSFGSKCFLSRESSFRESKTGCPGNVYYMFMAFNSAGFFASVFLVFRIYLFSQKTFIAVLLRIALSSMMCTYFTLSVSMSPEPLSLFVIYGVTVAIFVYSLLTFEWFKKFINKFICRREPPANTTSSA